MIFKYKKTIWAVCFILAIAMVYFTFFNYEKYHSAAEGLFDPAAYEEKYQVYSADINVHKTKFKKLLITHHVQLNAGDLTFELYDPAGKLVDSGHVTSDKRHSKQLKLEPVKGNWIVKYKTNETTDGKYMLIMESGS